VTTPTYTPSTAIVGTTYYFCVVTNTNNAATGATTAQTTSNIARIKVNALVDAATPVITNNLSTTQVEYNQNAAAAALNASATVTDGGAISYAWYSNTTNSTEGATALGVTTPTYTPSTAVVGTTYYFCVVTNTNNEATGATTAQTTSNIASIKVNTVGGGGSGSGGGSNTASLVTKINSGGSVTNTNMSKLAKEGKSLTVEGNAGEKLIIDNEALKNINGQTKETVKVEIKDVSDAHKDQQPGKIVFSLTITAGNKSVTSFGNGTATVSLPYELKAGEKAENVTVWYLAEDGTMSEIPCTYDPVTKLATFKVNHFSLYVVGTAETAPWANPFSDVKDGDWYYAAVQHAAENGLMKGTGSNTFSPELVTTRGMIATILYNLDGSGETALSSFKDVEPGAYYAHAVAWAQKKGIINGYGNEMFGPDDSITREQLAAMLWKYAGSPAAADSQGLASFKDGGEISAYAQNALAWANQEEIINGKGGGLLDPQGKATRAEAAQIFMNYLKAVK
jgi:hypothetical protein